MVRFKDRRDRDCVLGMTHEEIVASLAATELRSYRDLDVVVYQIQTKFRDEARSRGGLLRTREFLMKDAYSLHLTADGLTQAYNEQASAYRRIFQRLGLRDVAMVESSTGLMGGRQAHEFMCFLDVGEDTVATCVDCDYAANVDVAGDALKLRSVWRRAEWRRGVEIGNIFQLGTRYTDALGVSVTDAEGNACGDHGVVWDWELLRVSASSELSRRPRKSRSHAATAALDAHLSCLDAATKQWNHAPCRSSAKRANVVSSFSGTTEPPCPPAKGFRMPICWARPFA
jgi:prolyl-tRNA synthetase